MGLSIKKLSRETLSDFWEIHSVKNGEGWCFCTAWWIPSWDGWESRLAEQNRAVRESLIAQGISDGFILYDGCVPCGWCQAGPAEQTVKLCDSFNLATDSDLWAVTCMIIIPEFRGRGYATEFIRLILKECRKLGVKKIAAFPKKGEKLSSGDTWMGPLSVFQKNGFAIVRQTPWNWIMEAALD